MKQKIYSALLPIALMLIFSRCELQTETDDTQVVEGYSPVYGSYEDSQILFTQAHPVEAPGKIYVYGKYLLVNEQKKGIHVFDNSDPASPLNIGFIRLLGNTDMAIKNDTLYADHLGNLVSLTIRDFTTIQELGRLPLRNWNLGLPPPAGYYFECVNPEQGIVAGWKKTKLTNPHCYAIQ